MEMREWLALPMVDQEEIQEFVEMEFESAERDYDDSLKLFNGNRQFLFTEDKEDWEDLLDEYEQDCEEPEQYFYRGGERVC